MHHLLVSGARTNSEIGIRKFLMKGKSHLKEKGKVVAIKKLTVVAIAEKKEKIKGKNKRKKRRRSSSRS